MGFVVAIDGPAGSGKGTITKLIEEKLGLISIDTGAMYRCVTLYMIKNNIALNDEEKIKQLLTKINIDLRKEEGIPKFYLDGKDVSKEIREKEVNELVSQVSHIPMVRENMVNLQRRMAEGKRVIMEGRDIGTNVFPNANVKIYLDATPEERANRRYKQNIENGITDISYEEILQNVIFRDNNDKTSNIAPLRQAEDAVYLDSSDLTIEQVVKKIISIIKERE